jgi:hypothetical protein
MPWYAVVSFAAYAILLIWQVTLTVEAGRVGLLAIPYFLIKLIVMLVAFAYWDHDFCVLPIDRLGAGVLLAGGFISLHEALWILKPILITSEHPPEQDDLYIVVGLLTAVFLPASVLFFAGSVVLKHGCAI